MAFWRRPKHSDAAPDSSTAADISDEARGHITLPEPRLGVCGVLQLGPGGDSARAHEGQQRMEKQQGEARTTTPLSCLQDDRPPSYTVTATAQALRLDPLVSLFSVSLILHLQVPFELFFWKNFPPDVRHLHETIHLRHQ